MGYTPCTPAHRLRPKLLERHLQLLYKSNPKGEESDSKGILHENGVISSSRSQRQIINSGCFCAWSETENVKECPEDGSQVQGDSNEQQLLAMHPSAAGVPRPQRFQSALPVTNRFTRPSVWAQTAHSLPSFAAQTFTTHRQYRVCYGLANEQLFKPIDSPSSLLCSLAGSYMNENTACSFSWNTVFFSEQTATLHFRH